MNEPVYGLLEVLGRDDDLNYNVRLRVMRNGLNRNGWDYRNLDRYAESFKGTPILCAYLPGRIADGHNMRETWWNGEKIMDFTGPNAERIVGAIGEGEDDVLLETGEDGNTWVIAKGKLWRFYNRQLCDTIAEQGRMSVSAETEVTEEHEEEGMSVFTAWRGLGVTILHDTVTPAIPGANIQALKAMSSEQWNSLKLKVASYHPKTEGGEGTPPEGEPEPPKNNSEKEVKKTVNFTKKQLAKLNERFQGYVVMAAKENEEDHSILITMRNDAYEPFSYRLGSTEETIAPERILPLNATVSFGEDYQMAADDYFAALSARVDVLSADKEKLEKELTESRDALKAMKAAEKKRRKEASVAAVKNALERFNKDRSEKVPESAVAAILKNAEDGGYTECADGEGEWCGDEAAERDCLAECAKADMAAQEENARKAAEKMNSVYIWDKAGNKRRKDDGGIADLLARKGIRT